MPSAWMDDLTAVERVRAERILAGLVELGCDDADAAARSEVREGIPQLARHRFLHRLWPRLIDSQRRVVDADPVALRMVAAGADADDVVMFARTVAYETVFGMLYHLADDGVDADHLPGSVLMEVAPGGELTGRVVDSLYEDLLGMDPSGAADGADLSL